MAKNLVYNYTNQLTLPVPEGTKSGDPVAVGDLAGIAVTDRNSDGNAEVKVKGGPVAALSVKGIDASGNVAVAVGDKLYFTAADTPKIDKKATGTPYGHALGAVTSGATSTINVLITG
jgi:predicted RecA/RadA family phage recombinase